MSCFSGNSKSVSPSFKKGNKSTTNRSESHVTTTTDDSSSSLSFDSWSSSPSSSAVSRNDENIHQTCSMSNYVQSVIVLCLCNFTNAYLLISVFPYSGFMALHLLPNDNNTMTKETIGIYAGLIGGSFMFGRLLTVYEWGKLADKYGRVIVLQITLILCAICSFLFGLSQTYSLAIFWRFCLGMSCSLISIIKTSAIEISHGNEIKEHRAMGLVIGMRSVGLLLGPAAGGYLSEPYEQYPNMIIKLEHVLPKWCTNLLQDYPFLLPNILGTIICLLSAIAVTFFLEETLHEAIKTTENDNITNSTILVIVQDFLSNLISTIFSTIRAIIYLITSKIKPSRTCCDTTNGTGDEQQLLLQKISTTCGMTVVTATVPKQKQPTTISDNTNNYSAIINNKIEPEIKGIDNKNKNSNIGNDDVSRNSILNRNSIWDKLITRKHIIVHCCFTILNTMVDEAFPLFCMSSVGGLSLSESSIGNILSTAGIFFVSFQYITYSTLVSTFGIYKTISISCLCAIIPIGFIPLSVVFTSINNDSNLSPSPSSFKLSTWFIHGYLSILLSITRIMASTFLASLSIATNKTITKHDRAKLNSIVTIGISIFRGLSPIFAGWLVVISFSSSLLSFLSSLFPFISIQYLGSIIIFSTIVLIGLGVYIKQGTLEKDFLKYQLQLEQDQKKQLQQQQPQETEQIEEQQSKYPSIVV